MHYLAKSIHKMHPTNINTNHRLTLRCNVFDFVNIISLQKPKSNSQWNDFGIALLCRVTLRFHQRSYFRKNFPVNSLLYSCIWCRLVQTAQEGQSNGSKRLALLLQKLKRPYRLNYNFTRKEKRNGSKYISFNYAV